MFWTPIPPGLPAHYDEIDHILNLARRAHNDYLLSALSTQQGGALPTITLSSSPSTSASPWGALQPIPIPIPNNPSPPAPLSWIDPRLLSYLAQDSKDLDKVREESARKMARVCGALERFKEVMRGLLEMYEVDNGERCVGGHGVGKRGLGEEERRGRRREAAMVLKNEIGKIYE